ncbi:MAG: flagellar basal body rod protein FlgB [Spirochaetaceae bacterium]|jgi:flagellar basal-body rod protein FlgB|nr:flagellar basal body rod protein FlgB [Spirochaetaceae bacterium]
MFDNNSFGRNLDLLTRGMNVAGLRRGIIANNVANVDTPNFKRSEVSFEAELGRAIASENMETPMQARVSNVNHMPFQRPTDRNDVNARVGLDYLTTGKNNGNNVDIEREEMDALKNQMSYELMTSMVSHQFTMINMVIR